MTTRVTTKPRHKKSVNGELVREIVDLHGLDTYDLDLVDDFNELVLVVNGIRWEDRDKLATALMKRAIPKSKWHYASGKFQNTNIFREVKTGGIIKILQTTELVFTRKAGA